MVVIIGTGCVKEDERTRRIDRETAAHRALLAKDPKAGHEAEICTAVHRAVEDRLKSPASADFQSCIFHQEQVQYAGEGRYTFSSFVDAQNSFGASIRTQFDGDALIDDQGLKDRRFQITRLETH